MTSVLREVMSAFGDLREVKDIFDIENNSSNGSYTTLNKAPSVSFRKVKFSYANSKTILDDISFEIHPGMKIAIVGNSGSGKSTIAKLLYRFYETSSGCIEINNIDIKEFEINFLRKYIGIVPQDIVLFNNTLLYNITYGVSGSKMNSVLKMVKLDSFIDQLLMGLNTLVGERGLKISGGERQRIGIMRVLLKEPSILIFDEATSSLDPCMAQDVQKNINEICQNITTLIITHRLSSARQADKIFVLEGGKVIENGTHDALLSLNGSYKKQWDAQELGEITPQYAYT